MDDSEFEENKKVLFDNLNDYGIKFNDDSFS